MSSLVIEISTTGDVLEVELKGQINEDSSFEALKEQKQSKMVLNLSGVTHINSCGIREWIEFQNNNFDFDEIIYKECPQVVVEQMNIVSGFIHKRGSIESFYAPYYCESEDKEYKILITPEKVLDGKAPKMTAKNGEELEFDDIEAQYFNFLRK